MCVCVWVCESIDYISQEKLLMEKEICGYALIIPCSDGVIMLWESCGHILYNTSNINQYIHRGSVFMSMVRTIF